MRKKLYFQLYQKIKKTQIIWVKTRIKNIDFAASVDSLQKATVTHKIKY